MKIIFFGTHPDDLEISCGGTISKLNKKHDVYTAISRECEGERLKEQKKSNKILKIGKLHSYISNFTYRHGKVEMEEIDEVAKLIKIINPDRIYIPCIYDSNQHHRQLANMTLSALRRTNIAVYMYDTSTVKGITINKMIPNIYEDISKEFKKKIKACLCHKSQLKRLGYDYIKKFLKDKDRHNGYLAGCEYAEVFKIIKEVRK